MVRAILQQPELATKFPNLDPTVLLMVLLKQEYPDLPDSICRKIVPSTKEVQGDQLPWNRRQRRQILRARRVVVHLYSGPDQKTWKKLEDAHTVVICVDKLINPKMDMMNDQVMLFLMKLAMKGSLHGLIGGPPCRSVSACRYAEDGGPKPVRSEAEPYGLSTLSPAQLEKVEEDVTLLFRMMLLYSIAEHYKVGWCEKVLFALEQPQDPREYRSNQDVQRHGYMSI